MKRRRETGTRPERVGAAAAGTGDSGAKRAVGATKTGYFIAETAKGCDMDTLAAQWLAICPGGHGLAIAILSEAIVFIT